MVRAGGGWQVAGVRWSQTPHPARFSEPGGRAVRVRLCACGSPRGRARLPCARGAVVSGVRGGPRRAGVTVGGSVRCGHVVGCVGRTPHFKCSKRTRVTSTKGTLPAGPQEHRASGGGGHARAGRGVGARVLAPRRFPVGRGALAAGGVSGLHGAGLAFSTSFASLHLNILNM